MTDRNGTPLGPGDPVTWYGNGGPDDVIPATVLRKVGPGRFLIQMDPHDPSDLSRSEMADILELDIVAAGHDPAVAAHIAQRFREVDEHDPLEVSGDQLETRPDGT